MTIVKPNTYTVVYQEWKGKGRNRYQTNKSAYVIAASFEEAARKFTKARPKIKPTSMILAANLEIIQ